MVQTRGMSKKAREVAHFIALKKERKAIKVALDNNLETTLEKKNPQKEYTPKSRTPYDTVNNLRLKNDKYTVRTKQTVLGELAAYMTNDSMFNKFVTEVKKDNSALDISKAQIDNFRILTKDKELANMIKPSLTRYGAVKLTVALTYTGISTDGKDEKKNKLYVFSNEKTAYTHNAAAIIKTNDDLIGFMRNQLPRTIISVCQEQAARYQFKSFFIDEISFNAFEYQPFKAGGSYIPYPKLWTHTKSLINPKNLADNFCFYLAVLLSVFGMNKSVFTDAISADISNKYDSAIKRFKRNLKANNIFYDDIMLADCWPVNVYTHNKKIREFEDVNKTKIIVFELR